MLHVPVTSLVWHCVVAFCACNPQHVRPPPPNSRRLCKLDGIRIYSLYPALQPVVRAQSGGCSECDSLRHCGEPASACLCCALRCCFSMAGLWRVHSVTKALLHSLLNPVPAASSLGYDHGMDRRSHPTVPQPE